MRRRLFIAITLAASLLLILTISPVFAEMAGVAELPEKNDLLISQADQPSEIELKLDTSYLVECFSDTKEILISPIHWGKEEWLKASWVLGTTIILYNNDPAIQNYFQENRNSSTDTVSGFVKNFGDYRVVIPSLALFYAYGISAQDEKAQQAALLCLESLTVADGIICSFKIVSHRHRPSTGDPYDTWDGFCLSIDDNSLSFPSFHSATAFAVATCISSVYEDHEWLPYMAYSLATLTALSRMNDNEHWCSDVFFGSAIGYFTAKTIFDHHQNGTVNHITMIPTLNGQKVGLSLSVHF